MVLFQGRVLKAKIRFQFVKLCPGFATGHIGQSLRKTEWEHMAPCLKFQGVDSLTLSMTPRPSSTTAKPSQSVYSLQLSTATTSPVSAYAKHIFGMLQNALITFFFRAPCPGCSLFLVSEGLAQAQQSWWQVQASNRCRFWIMISSQMTASWQWQYLNIYIIYIMYIYIYIW